MKKFPFITLNDSLVLLRVMMAIVFLAHAIVRIFNGTIPRFGGYLESKGFIMGNPIVYAITTFEIVGGVMLAFGYFTRWLALGFIILLIIGIGIIHAAEGWFVGEHGSGGMEYSVALIVSLIVVAATPRSPKGEVSAD